MFFSRRENRGQKFSVSVDVIEIKIQVYLASTTSFFKPQGLLVLLSRK